MAFYLESLSLKSLSLFQSLFNPQFNLGIMYIKKLPRLIFIWMISWLCLLYRAWIARRAKLDQCLEMQLFNRDCEQAETWMAAREQSLRDDQVGHYCSCVVCFPVVSDNLDTLCQEY